MPPLLDRLSSRERLRIACALAFWAATYLLFATWNQLQSEYPLALWQSRRLIATLWGALLFFAFTRLADRIDGRSLRERSLILLGGAVACGVAMILGRATIDHFLASALHEQTSSWSRHLRFTMIWGGYFGGAAIAFLSFTQSLAKPAEAQEAEAPAEPQGANDSNYPDALWVSRGRETVRVSTDAIDWIEAEGDYVRLHARTGGGLLRGTLSGLEARLDPATFARVHRSAICRRDAVVAMLRKPSGAMAVRLDSGIEVPVGRRYRDAVAELLGQNRDTPSKIPA